VNPQMGRRQLKKAKKRMPLLKIKMLLKHILEK
jgi:hypothetical protein